MLKSTLIMKRAKLVVILSLAAAALAAPGAVFLARPPVLVVTDALFASLYGGANLKRQRDSAAWALHRRVKPVMVVDGAGPDIVVFAVAEASRRPWCVLFAYSQAPAARLFHEQYPQTPAVLFKGHAAARDMPAPDGILCVYGTDRQVDLYRAGLFAGIIGTWKQEIAEQEDESPPPAPKTYALWHDRSVRAAVRELFSQGVQEYDPDRGIIFANSASAMPDPKGLVCAVLNNSGAEYLEKNPKIPIILFSWLDFGKTAQEVVIQFDDSPWALAVPAARMAALGEAEGEIPSLPLIFSGKIADNKLSRALKKSAKKIPENIRETY